MTKRISPELYVRDYVEYVESIQIELEQDYHDMQTCKRVELQANDLITAATNLRDMAHRVAGEG